MRKKRDKKRKTCEKKRKSCAGFELFQWFTPESRGKIFRSGKSQARVSAGAPSASFQLRRPDGCLRCQWTELNRIALLSEKRYYIA